MGRRTWRARGKLRDVSESKRGRGRGISHREPDRSPTSPTRFSRTCRTAGRPISYEPPNPIIRITDKSTVPAACSSTRSRNGYPRPWPGYSSRPAAAAWPGRSARCRARAGRSRPGANPQPRRLAESISGIQRGTRNRLAPDTCRARTGDRSLRRGGRSRFGRDRSPPGGSIIDDRVGCSASTSSRDNQRCSSGTQVFARSPA